MKEIKIYLNDDEYLKLLDVKQNKRWKDFLMELASQSTRELYIINEINKTLEFARHQFNDERLVTLDLVRILALAIIEQDKAKAKKVLEKLSEYLKDEELAAKEGEIEND